MVNINTFFFWKFRWYINKSYILFWIFVYLGTSANMDQMTIVMTAFTLGLSSKDV